MRDKLLTALKLVLDENRVATWQLVDKEFPDKLFNGFGSGSLTLTLRQKGGLCSLQEERKTRRRSTRTQGTATKEVLSRYARFAKHFPEVIRKQVPDVNAGMAPSQRAKPRQGASSRAACRRSSPTGPKTWPRSSISSLLTRHGSSSSIRRER